MASEEVDPATVGVDSAPASRQAETEALTPAAWADRGRQGPPLSAADGSPLAGEPMEPRARFLGRYLILRELGRGGMGVVYTAYDPELDRKVALKVLRPDPLFHERQARLQREAQALARLSHPNVIQVYDVGTVGDQVFLAMELVKGENLGVWLEARPRSWPEVVACFVAAGEGLAAAHAAGIVHRDFKPGNVLVGRDGRVRVLDFGIARPVERGKALESDPDRDLDAATVMLSASHSLSEDVSGQLTRLGQVLGTPRYIAPELVFGRPPDARSDQFAFGVALFEALYGVSPFAGEDVTQLAFAAVDGRLAGEPAGRRVPSWLRRAVVRTLAGDPAARYVDMVSLLADLRRDRAAERRKRLLLAAVPLAVLVAVGTWRLGVAQREAVCGGGRALAASQAWITKHQ
jgi:serine/threonine protein kinase